MLIPVAVLVVGCVSKLPNFLAPLKAGKGAVCWAGFGAINVLSCQRSAVRNCYSRKRNRRANNNNEIRQKERLEMG